MKLGTAIRGGKLFPSGVRRTYSLFKLCRPLKACLDIWHRLLFCRNLEMKSKKTELLFFKYETC